MMEITRSKEELVRALTTAKPGTGISIALTDSELEAIGKYYNDTYALVYTVKKTALSVPCMNKLMNKAMCLHLGKTKDEKAYLYYSTIMSSYSFYMQQLITNPSFIDRTVAALKEKKQKNRKNYDSYDDCYNDDFTESDVCDVICAVISDYAVNSIILANEETWKKNSSEPTKDKNTQKQTAEKTKRDMFQQRLFSEKDGALKNYNLAELFEEANKTIVDALFDYAEEARECTGSVWEEAGDFIGDVVIMIEKNEIPDILKKFRK